MSTLNYDQHTVCVTCRNNKCDQDNRSDECVAWNVKTIEVYVKRRKSQHSKSSKKPVVSEVVVVTLTGFRNSSC